jgi:hypothetical protein
MQVSNISQQAYGSSVYEKQVLGKVKQDKNTIEPQKTQITTRTKPSRYFTKRQKISRALARPGGLK